MSRNKSFLTDLPESIQGTWEVVSFRSASGESGCVSDVWEFFQGQVSLPEATLFVTTIEADLEPHQDLHLLTFSNSQLQFALVRSFNRAQLLLVTAFFDGQEQMRYLLRKLDLYPGLSPVDSFADNL